MIAAGSYCPAGSSEESGLSCPAGSYCLGGSSPPVPCKNPNPSPPTHTNSTRLCQCPACQGPATGPSLTHLTVLPCTGPSLTRPPSSTQHVGALQRSFFDPPTHSNRVCQCPVSRCQGLVVTPFHPGQCPSYPFPIHSHPGPCPHPLPSSCPHGLLSSIPTGRSTSKARVSCDSGYR